jgi:hypothetical protein
MIRKWSARQLDLRLAELVEDISRTVSPFGGVEDDEDRRHRRERAKHDKEFFKRSYFPHYARQAEPEFREDIQGVCNARNEPQLLLGFRGCGKSTDVSLIDAVHEILFGTAKFFVFISRSVDIAVAEYAHPIRAELSSNPRIKNDFGDIRIDGVNDDYTANDVRVLCGGIRSSYRGKKHRGRRPDRIRLEDIEDNNNRMKPLMIKKYLRVLHDDILQSVGAGADEEWSVIYLANYFSKRSLVHAVRVSGIWNVCVIRALRLLAQGEESSSAIASETSTWPERYPTAQLLELRRKAPSSFRTEWQQEPEDEEHAFRREWFLHYKPGDPPPDAFRYAWVDPSPGERATSDYKAYGVADFVLHDGVLQMYLLAAHVRKETVNQMLAAMYEMHNRFPGIRLWGYEAVSSERYLEQLVQRDAKKYGFALPLFPALKNLAGFPFKKDRIPQMQSVLEKGFCFFPVRDPDCERIIEHYLDYPDGVHDDGADMHSGLYKFGEHTLLGQNILATNIDNI